MKKLVFVIFIIFVSLTVTAQNITFENVTHDFGKVKQEDGSISTEFTFKNTGTVPIKLIDVQASCGCTKPEWTQEEVLPNGKGIIKVGYDAGNRPGAIDKTITVKTNQSPEIIVLRIIGEVIPKPKNPTDIYVFKSGNLRMYTNFVDIGKIKHDSVKLVKFLLYNESNKPLKLNFDHAQLPDYIKFINAPKLIPAKDSVFVSLEYSALKKKDWGFVYEKITFNTDDEDTPQKQLQVVANIIENFATTNKKAKIPSVSFDKTAHNFGNVKQFSKNNAIFNLTNVGEGTLHIRKVQTSCGCTIGTPKKIQLAPGESTEIEVIFDSGDRIGLQNKSITVICNDPKSPETILMVNSFVEN
jgi:hypothetical protein